MTRKFWNAHTLLKLLFPLIVGILVSQTIEIKQSELLYGLLAVSILLSFLLALVSLPQRVKWLGGLGIAICFFLFGFANFQIYQKTIPQFTNDYDAKKVVFALKILENPTQANRSVKALTQIIQHQNQELIGEKLLLSLAPNLTDSLTKGDVLFANHYINEIQPPQNPYSFNYREFMRKKGVLYQTYLSENQTIEVAHVPEKQNFIDRLRTTGFRFVEQYVSENNQGVAKALLFGSRTDLDKETANNFSDAGTMHILAVSGLHVGIIFLLASMLLAFVERKLPVNKWLKLLFLLTIIWVFVFLTGAKASVSRAGIMFSLFVIGAQFFPKSYSLNTLAFAAILLLALFPNYLFDVGFQLSFSAVAGILLVVPFFQRLLPIPKSKIIKYFLDISYVSIAAQLATLPFTIYYFQQYPMFGLFANLLAIPLAFAIVAVGFIGFLMSWLPVFPQFAGKLLDILLSFLQYLNQTVADLPFSTINNLYLTQVEFILLFIAVVCFAILLKSKQGKFLVLMLLSLVAMAGSIVLNKWQVTQKKEFLVYCINNNMVAKYQNGRVAYIFAQNEISDNSFEYSILPDLKANYIQQKNFYSFTDSVKTTDFQLKNGLLVLPNRNILFTDDLSKTPSNVSIIISAKADYKQLYTAKDLAEHHQIILANTYPNRVVLDTPVNLHFLKTEGFYRAD